MRDFSHVLSTVDKARERANDNFKQVLELSNQDDVVQFEQSLNQVIIDLRVQLFELENVQDYVRAELKKKK